MATFVIYDTATGMVQGVCTATNHPDDVMGANTPEGCSALLVDVPSGEPIVGKGWQVVDGVLSQVVPTDAELLASAKAVQLGLLAVGYAAAKTQNVAYMGTYFMGDEDSQQLFANAQLIYAAAGATPADFYAVDASYNKVPMTLDQLKGLTAVFAAQVWVAFQRWVAVRTELAMATTVAGVQAIVW